MFTHISMFRIKNRDRLREDLAVIRKRLEEFPANIPAIAGCRLIENGLGQPPKAPETLVFCDLIQILTFATKEALEAYPQDAFHQQMVKDTDHLLERVCIIDYEQ